MKKIQDLPQAILLKQGTTLGLSEMVLDFFPEYDIGNLTEEKKHITLKHMLTMSSGLEWYEMDYPYGGSSMRLTPRDMARFGLLYLNKGKWENTQIIPEDWVLESQQKHIQRKYIEDYYYGYHWWVSDHNTYSAVGYGGQWITIIPEHDMVLVFTNSFDEGDALQWNTPQRLIDTYILPSIK